MADKKSNQDPAKAAFLAALEKKKAKGSAQAGSSHAEGKGSTKGAQSGVTRRIERRRSGSS
jgi:hypothetical protein